LWWRQIDAHTEGAQKNAAKNCTLQSLSNRVPNSLAKASHTMDVGVPPEPEPADRIATLRSVCLGGLCTDAELAEALSASLRTVRRYVARGMPVVMICRRRYFEPAAVSAWLLENGRRTAKTPDRPADARPRAAGSAQLSQPTP
jgi:hypothetical protein